MHDDGKWQLVVPPVCKNYESRKIMVLLEHISKKFTSNLASSILTRIWAKNSSESFIPTSVSPPSNLRAWRLLNSIPHFIAIIRHIRKHTQWFSAGDQVILHHNGYNITPNRWANSPQMVETKKTKKTKNLPGFSKGWRLRRCQRLGGVDLGFWTSPAAGSAEQKVTQKTARCLRLYLIATCYISIHKNWKHTLHSNIFCYVI